MSSGGGHQGVQRTVSSPNGLRLLQVDGRVAEEVEHREEAGDDLEGPGAVGGERGERGAAQRGEAFGQERRLLGDRHLRGVQVVDADGGRGLGPEHRGRELGERRGVDAEQHLRQQHGEPLFQRHRAREPPRRARLQLHEEACDLLVRAVLQQPREQQVAGLQQGEVLGVLHLGVGQQAGGLEVEQRGRDDQELRGLVEVRVVAEGREVGDEVVGDAVQRHLGDVQLVLADQLQEQVERALEVVQPDREARRRGLGRSADGSHRARTSRASSR